MSLYLVARLDTAMNGPRLTVIWPLLVVIALLRFRKAP
jgi:hypothetical protein